MWSKSEYDAMERGYEHDPADEETDAQMSQRVTKFWKDNPNGYRNGLFRDRRNSGG